MVREIRALRADPGFTLVEAVCATALLVCVAVGVAPLFLIATRDNLDARRQTIATVLAAQKMEQLRALAWRFDSSAAGQRVSDTTTDLSRDPPTASGRGLSPSPPDALAISVAGYADFVDHLGRWIGAGPVPPPTASWVRRWSIEPLSADPEDTLVLQVVVAPVAREPALGTGSDRVRVSIAEGVRLVCLRTRTIQ